MIVELNIVVISDLLYFFVLELSLSKMRQYFKV